MTKATKNTYKVLSQEEVIELAKKAEQGDAAARETLILANVGLVKKYAKEMLQKAGSSILEFEDLVNEGMIGLFTAVDKFDYRRDISFATYATYWILDSLRLCVKFNNNAIRLPVSKQAQLNKILSARKFLTEETGKEPSVEQIAALTGMSGKIVLNTLKAQKLVISLDTPCGSDDDENCTLGSFIAAEDQNVAENLELSELKNLIAEAFEVLDDRERAIITYHYGLDDGEPKSLTEIGELVNLTKQRTFQLEKQAMYKLRWVKNGRLFEGYAAA